MTVRVLIGDCRDVLRTLPDESVHCVVTSPPYYGLRNYGVDGQIGLEPDFRSYIATMVEVFREVRRVLRKDGVCWLNLGDSYATGAGAVGARPGGGEQGDRWAGHRGDRDGAAGKHEYAGLGPMTQPNRMPETGFKPKDRMMVPARVAIALQEDGWWLRDEIVWHKPNPMPSSVADRTTLAHEMIYLLSRSARYFFDQEAIKEAGGDDVGPGVGGRAVGDDHTAVGHNQIGTTSHGDLRKRPSRSAWTTPAGWDTSKGNGGHGSFHREGREKGRKGYQRAKDQEGAAVSPNARSPHSLSDFEDKNGGAYPTRNKRSVWTVATQPYPDAHFATFPTALIEPCILAGCPKECCAKCGAPWVREVEREGSGRVYERGTCASDSRALGVPQRSGSGTGALSVITQTLGFSPSCACNAGTTAGTCLDPFGGAGTTGLVADRLQRNAILIELNPAYAEMAERRIRGDSPLFSQIERADPV